MSKEFVKKASDLIKLQTELKHKKRRVADLTTKIIKTKNEIMELKQLNNDINKMQ